MKNRRRLAKSSSVSLPVVGRVTIARGRELFAKSDYFRFFLVFPQTSPCVHSFRTAGTGFSVAQTFTMRDIAITAGVDITLPVIAQGWFCGSSRGRAVERFPKRASVAGNPGVAASSETVSHGGTAKPARRDPDATAPLVQMRHRSSWPTR
jgi:hypothetical protein